MPVKHQRDEQLHRANPGPDRGAQLHVPAAHAAQPEKKTVNQKSKPQTGKALAKTMPAKWAETMPAKALAVPVPVMTPRGDHNPRQQKW